MPGPRGLCLYQKGQPEPLAHLTSLIPSRSCSPQPLRGSGLADSWPCSVLYACLSASLQPYSILQTTLLMAPSLQGPSLCGSSSHKVPTINIGSPTPKPQIKQRASVQGCGGLEFIRPKTLPVLVKKSPSLPTEGGKGPASYEYARPGTYSDCPQELGVPSSFAH